MPVLHLLLRRVFVDLIQGRISHAKEIGTRTVHVAHVEVISRTIVIQIGALLTSLLIRSYVSTRFVENRKSGCALLTLTKHLLSENVHNWEAIVVARIICQRCALGLPFEVQECLEIRHLLAGTLPLLGLGSTKRSMESYAPTMAKKYHNCLYWLLYVS
jgi:hypothetical protein